MKERSEETVMWHMYGLSKIFEHRGIPDLDSEVEYKMMLGSLPLVVSDDYLNELKGHQELIQCHVRSCLLTTATFRLSYPRRIGSTPYTN